MTKKKQGSGKTEKKPVRRAGMVPPDALNGVVYVGNVPRGFHEVQMEAFFKQFGRVLTVRLSRSKRTGNSKGYAYVRFEFDEVAKVAAETMNNYLMYKKLLKCKYIAPEDVHPLTFKGSWRKFSAPKAHVVNNNRHDREKSTQKETVLKHRAASHLQKKLNKLAALGVLDYSLQVGDKTVSGKLGAEPEAEPEATGGSPTGEILLEEDSSDDEIRMKTPPGSLRVKKAKARVDVKAKAPKATTKGKVDKVKAKPVSKLTNVKATSKGRMQAFRAAKGIRSRQ